MTRWCLTIPIVLASLSSASPASAVNLIYVTHRVDDSADRIFVHADSQFPRGVAEWTLRQKRLVVDIPADASTLEPVYRVSGVTVRSVEVTDHSKKNHPKVRLVFDLNGTAEPRFHIKGAVLEVVFPTGGGFASGASKPGVSTIQQDVEALAASADGEEVYRLGVGDRLRIEVLGNPDLSGTYVVDAAGLIEFPLVGVLAAQGLSERELTVLLARRLDRDYLVEPQVTVRVEEHRSQYVDLVGEVRRPGRYYLDGPTRLLDVLADAGGATDLAGDVISISRPDRDEVEHFRVARSLMSDHPEMNLLVESGDFVEVRGKEGIMVVGEVQHPGSYDWSPQLTILDAMARAGGPTVWAKDHIEILRGQQTIEVDLREVRSGDQANVELKPGDHVTVGRRIL